ncbi:hypothetical protein CDD82_1875 [Ophiocordyceps australis]|uniref:ADP-ribosylhydrolase ARH3 n=1 Tax=Ophiocordyceps australis TaxID=1399860 RepID=A0A2C5ZK94_9HYPO|nr:hypothetical protein CDD82_1875 [Ophiocordyceps australis]
MCHQGMTVASHAMTIRQSRVLGAMLGLHAGDSLGATLEFDTHEEIKAKYPDGLQDIIGGGTFDWPAGHATDDTDMARAVMLAYRERTGPEDDVARRAAEWFLRWKQGIDWPDRQPGSTPKDIGLATAVGLDRYAETRDPDQAGAGVNQAGNGSLMRCLATGLWQGDAEKRRHESIRISAVTHNDARCTVSCAVYNAMVARLVSLPAKTSASEAATVALVEAEAEAERLEADSPTKPVLRALGQGMQLSVEELARNGPQKGSLPGKARGYVLETLALAVAALRDERPLRDVLVDVVRVGGDTDTNAAVAGGLLGARDGHEAIPEAWSEKLQFGSEFRQLMLDMVSED